MPAPSRQAARRRPPNVWSPSSTSWPDIRTTGSGCRSWPADSSLSKPTCLGIVTTLTEAGYLVRDVAGQDLSAGSGADLARAHRPGVDAGQPRRP